MYSDEAVAGDQLPLHNLRKCGIVYWSCVDCGSAVLSDEDAWFCAAAERSGRVKQFQGGIGQTCGCILKHLFAHGGHTLQNAGILLELPDGTTTRVFAKLHTIFQNGGAHKQVLW